MQDSVERIQADNENATTLAELIPLLIRIIALYHDDKITLPPLGNSAHFSSRCWSPSFVRGRERPQKHSRPFWGIQLAQMLDRLQNKGNGQFKLDRNMSAALRLLEYHETQGIPLDSFESLAKNMSGRAQMELARTLSKK